jgi:hypothetical protein
MTEEERERAVRLQAAIDRIKAQILAAKPDAGPDEVGGLFDAYGSAVWVPSRPAGVDFSAWGAWEVWEHQEPVSGGLRPTGDWVAWDSSTGSPGRQLGFSNKSVLSAREQAEMMAVLQNGGCRTRVVTAAGGFSSSRMKFEHVRSLVEERMALMGAGQPAVAGEVS